MLVSRAKLKSTRMAAQFWILISVGLCSIQVSAYSAHRRDNNYLLHDTREQQQEQQQQQQQQLPHQQIVQELDGEDVLKTGTRSSQTEMNFHPLGDFSGATTLRESSSTSGETSLFEPHSSLLQHGRGVEHQQVDQQQPHHQNYQHQKVEFLRLRPEDDFHFQELNGYNNLKSNNDLSAESGISSNNGNYADIDNIYKQDMPGGNYNSQRWNGDSAKDDTRGVWSWLNDDVLNDGQKRSAFHAIKRQKSRKRQAQFMPGISVGAMTNLGDFFDNLQNNLEYLEKGDLTDEQLQILDGQHPLTSLKKEISMASNENDSSWHNNGPHGTAAFIHAIRTYRPSNRIRNLISSVPDGYRGTNLHDPNYKWIGLGKRSNF